MTAPRPDQIADSPDFAIASPRLSVLIPFLRYDVRPLLDQLDREGRGAALGSDVEVILLDDGSDDPVRTAELTAALRTQVLPTRLVTLSRNVGRSRGRNRLFAEARADHVLFLDCDMAPDRPDFLQIWLRLIESDNPTAAFGGFSLDQTRPTRDQRLHHALQLRGECAKASVRRLAPEKYVFTSNLLVRRDVFLSEGFDEGFHGWGWEDVEWGMRVARRFGVSHIDNAATHLGLDAAADLLRKYEQSAANFERVLARHPGFVRRYPSYRVSRLLRPLPAKPVWRAWLKSAALMNGPMSLRVLAAKLYRAALYAEVAG